MDGTDFAMLTLSRNAVTSSSEIMNAELDDLHIVRWDETENSWVDQGGVAIPDSDAIKTITSVTGYGVFALAVVSSLPPGIEAYNYLSPNGDGLNDVLLLEGIEKFPDNIVQIFNRWGSQIAEIKGYNNEDRVFGGYATTGIRLQTSELLPSGTYFYSLEYKDGDERIKKIDYLFINGK
jgi:gliding motility-associated-like protein